MLIARFDGLVAASSLLIASPALADGGDEDSTLGPFGFC
jgi:hypothetical protein